jgi:hypothetical protein
MTRTVSASRPKFLRKKTIFGFPNSSRRLGIERKKWLSPVLEKLHELLVNEPDKMILQRKAFQQCVSIFEANGISPNNFYKSLHTISWLESRFCVGK